MEQVTCWRANDGKLFDTEDACRGYEATLRATLSATQLIEAGAPLMLAFDAYYKRCGFPYPTWADSLSPDGARLLTKITNKTKISIPHWQCEDRPMFSVVGMNEKGQVYIFTAPDERDVTWPRPYGNYCSLDDLIRYAVATQARYPDWTP